MKELLTIQRQLSIEKKRTGIVDNNKFKYWHYEDILRDSRAILQANNCFISFSEEIFQIGGKAYISSTAYLTNSIGESYYATGVSRESFNSNIETGQMTEIATSYARKAALTGLFGLYPSNQPDLNKEPSNIPLMTAADKLTIIKEQAQNRGDTKTAGTILKAISENNPDTMQELLNQYADYIKDNPIELRL